MYKKNIGICIIFLGGVIFLWTCYGLVKNFTTSKEEMVEQLKMDLDKKGLYNYLTEEELEKMIDDGMKTGRTFSLISLLIGGAITFGGYALLKSGKRDEHLSDKFKFD